MTDKPAIHFQSRHESGNIYFILGKVSDALHKEQMAAAFDDLRDRVFSSGSYQNALDIIRETVDLIDDDGVY